MEYLLQHRVLETMYSLARTDVSKTMRSVYCHTAEPIDLIGLAKTKSGFTRFPEPIGGYLCMTNQFQLSGFDFGNCIRLYALCNVHGNRDLGTI